MPNFLISFPSPAMVLAPEDFEGVAHSAREVVRDAKAAGVFVFAGGIDESVPPVMVEADGTVTEGTYPQTREIEGGYMIVAVPSRDEALEWAARVAAGCRCAQELRQFQDDPESLP